MGAPPELRTVRMERPRAADLGYRLYKDLRRTEPGPAPLGFGRVHVSWPDVTEDRAARTTGSHSVSMS